MLAAKNVSVDELLNGSLMLMPLEVNADVQKIELDSECNSERQKIKDRLLNRYLVCFLVIRFITPFVPASKETVQNIF